jgi:hypothetical protein
MPLLASFARMPPATPATSPTASPRSPLPADLAACKTAREHRAGVASGVELACGQHLLIDAFAREGLLHGALHRFLGHRFS